jgi:hypothetical protein
MTTLSNATVLAGIKVVTDKLAWFQSVLKHWPKGAGDRPTDAMLMVPLLIDGKRPGVEALHIAMCLRDGGCTVQQFMLAGSCGPANNYRRALVKTGWFKLTVAGKPYAYTMTITEKGAAKLAKAQAAAEAEAGETAKAPAKRKATKAKRKAKGTVTVPAVTQAPQGETPTGDHPEGGNDTAAGEALQVQGDTAQPQA